MEVVQGKRLSSMKLPIIILAIVISVGLFGDLVDEQIKAHLYAVSITIQKMLVCVLPLVIFSFLFNSVQNIGKGSLRVIFLIVFFVCMSNFFSTILAYFISLLSISDNVISSVQSNEVQHLEVAWELSLTKLGLGYVGQMLNYITNDIALLSGVVLGLMSTYAKSEKGKIIGEKLMKTSLFILNKLFIPSMPLFITGFILKMQHEKVLSFVLQDYLKVFIILFLTLYGYICVLHFILARCEFKRFVDYIKNLIPAIITGFCTMSSAVSLPFLLKATENNTKKADLTRVVVPSIVNIHLIGDCFAINIMAVAMMLSYGMDFPSFDVYLVFAIYFVIAKFAVAAVPGGGIIVMIPILIKHLGFSPEMVSLITVLYIIFDPLITSANISGNSALAICITKVYKQISKKKRELLIS